MQIDTTHAQSLTDMTEFLQYLVSVYGNELYKNKRQLTNLIADLYTGEERLKRLYRKAIIEDNLSVRVFELTQKTAEERKALLEAIAYQFAEDNFYSYEIGQKFSYTFAEGINLLPIPLLIKREDGTLLDRFGVIYSNDRRTLIKCPCSRYGIILSMIEFSKTASLSPDFAVFVIFFNLFSNV